MNRERQCFNIGLACDLLRKSVDEVSEMCADFQAELSQTNRLMEIVFFDKSVGFNCHFELKDYKAFCCVGVNFVNNIAVECIISLGMPEDVERYGSEVEVTKVFLVSLEELYLNGRIQEGSEVGTRVYTWKKDDRTVVSFICYPTSGSRKDSGASLSVQIRDTKLHPEGADFELLYSRAKK